MIQRQIFPGAAHFPECERPESQRRGRRHCIANSLSGEALAAVARFGGEAKVLEREREERGIRQVG